MEAINLEIIALAAVLPLPLPLPAAATPPAVAMTPPDSHLLKAVLDELDTLLSQHDTAAITHFNEYAAVLRAALGPPCEQLGRQINAFAFEAVQLTLRGLR